MAYEDLFKDPYWRAFKRDYELKHGGKLDLNTGKIIPNNQNTINYEQILSRRPVRQTRQIDLGSIITGGRTQAVPNIPSTSGNTFGGYGSIYSPKQSIFDKPITGYGTTNKAIPEITKSLVDKNPSLLSKLKGAGKLVGPLAGLGEVFLGKTPQSKILGAIGGGLSLVPHPAAKVLGTGALIGSGIIDTYSNSQSQIDKSNKDFAKYESMFGTPDNPNLSNLAPALKPLREDEVAMLQYKANMANQPQADTTQLVQTPTAEQYQEATNQVINNTMNEQNKLNEIANSLQPQPVQYRANIFGQNVYNATPDLSAATENTIDQMNQAIQGVPNLYQNMFGQGGTEVGSNALASYMQLLGKQQQAKQAMAEQMLAGYQEAAKRDRYQDLINGISDAFQNYNYNRSLVFLPSGFNPNGGQTFTPVHLANAPKERGQQETNVDRYLAELKLRQQLTPDNTAMNEAMTQALQAQALGEATGTNPWLYMGDSELSKQMMDKVLGPQIQEGAKARTELAKLTPATYAKMVEELNKAKAESIKERMKGEYGLAEKNIEKFADTDISNAEQQNKFFTDYMNNYVNLAKQGMSDENALARLRLTGMNNEQLAILKADLESSNPVKQMNAAAQIMNAFTRFATPQEAQAYQNQLFPGGIPQFSGTPRQ